MRAKYEVPFLWSQAPQRQSHSPPWAQLRKLRHLLQVNCHLLLGNGESNFWDADWTGLGPLRGLLQNNHPPYPLNLKINQVMGPDGLLQNKSFPASLPASVRLHITSEGMSLRQGEDRIIWTRARWAWYPLLPPKIAIFSWKILHKAVLVDIGVKNKGIQMAFACVCCQSEGRSEESLDHLFVGSELASAMWSFFSSSLDVDCLPNQSADIWLARNEHRFENRPFSIQHSINKLINPLPTFSVVKWIRPPRGWVKLNVDGSSRGNTGLSGSGGVCRNKKSEFLFAFAIGYGVGSNFMAKVRAVVDSLKLCKDLGYSNVEVESDSITVVNLFSNTGKAHWFVCYCRHQLDILRSAIATSIKHIPWQANAVADSLARWGSSNQQYWLFHSASDLPCSTRGELVLDRVGLGTIRF
ncbi:uncharacterized protein LOC131247128 [Magnolia sinica]|uniref:uncharacterized protein LOC131247128 n=1 Tax=Magnolia sinica TaxID=86752 RepID=UPI002658DE76|nr:uncharacterized protein LOC131247128 [Magnolia sinica]